MKTNTSALGTLGIHLFFAIVAGLGAASLTGCVAATEEPEPSAAGGTPESDTRIETASDAKKTSGLEPSARMRFVEKAAPPVDPGPWDGNGSTHDGPTEIGRKRLAE